MAVLVLGCIDLQKAFVRLEVDETLLTAVLSSRKYLGSVNVCKLLVPGVRTVINFFPRIFERLSTTLTCVAASR